MPHLRQRGRSLPETTRGFRRAQPQHMRSCTAILHVLAMRSGTCRLCGAGDWRGCGTAPPPAQIPTGDGMRGDALPLGTILLMSRGSGDVMGNVRHRAPPRVGGLPGSHAPQPAGLGLGGVGRACGWGLMFLAHFLSFSLPLPMLGKARGRSIGVGGGLARCIASPPVGPCTPPRSI
jgi:hypothetical protein